MPEVADPVSPPTDLRKPTGVSDGRSVSPEPAVEVKKLELLRGIGAGPEGPSDSAVVELLTAGLARTEDFLEAVPEKVRTLVENVGRLVGGLEKAVKNLLGGGRAPAGVVPSGDPGPAAPPPAPPVPVSSGCSATSGTSFEGSGSCGGAAGKLLGHFAVLTPFSVAVPQMNEVVWMLREPLRPESAPRPPNERPG